MSSKIEKKEKSIVTLSLNVSVERFEEGMKYSYNKNKNSVSLPGFRKGKAPRALIEKQYGREFFMDDAINFVFPEEYQAAVKEHALEPVSRPEIDLADYNDEEGLTLSVLVTVKPDVTLGEYKGLSFNDYDTEVTDSEADEEISRDREKNARIVTVTDRPAELGDTAIIAFEGFVDGEPFEGGKSENHELVLGSKTFIDTFEEQLVGKNAGDSTEVSVTFPDNYGSPDLAGKHAIFKVSIKELTKKELPALDDDFAQDVSEFDTYDEYKSSVKDKLKSQKDHKKEHDIEDELIKKVSENAEVDIPEAMVENQINQMIMDFEARLRSQGLDLRTFIGFSGQSEEAFVESFREPAINNVKARLVLEEIAKTEELSPTEEDIEEEIKKISEAYGIEEEKLRSTLRDEDRKGLEVDLRTRKALDVIVKSAVPTKDEGKDDSK